jgi:hypothetical protein
MPRYLIERSVAPLSKDELGVVARRSIDVCTQLGITWVKSYYSAENGKFYCEYEASNAELLWKHAKLGQIPIDKVYPIDVVVDPAMFK